MKAAVLGTFSRQIFALLLGLMSISKMSKNLGAQEFGYYSIAVTLSTAAVILFFLSVPSVIIHFFSQAKEGGKVGRLIGTGVAIYLVAALVCILVSIFMWKMRVIDSYFPSLKLLFVFVLIVLVQGWNSICESSLLGGKQYGFFNGLQLLPPVLLFFSVLFLGKINADWEDYFLAYALIYCCSLPLYTILMYQSLGRSKLVLSFVGLKSTYLGYGIKMWMANLVTVCFYRLPYILADALLGVRSVGLYSVASQFSEKLWVPGRAFASIVFPERSSDSQKNSKTAFYSGLKAIFLNMGLVLIGAIGLYFFFEFFSSSLFGPEYESVSTLVLALAPGIVAWAGVTVSGAELAARGRSGANLVSSSVALLVSFPSMWVGAQYGLFGFVLGLSVGYVFGFLVSLYSYFSLKKNILP